MPEKRTIVRRPNFERRASYIERPATAFCLLLLFATLATPSVSGFRREAELLPYRFKTRTTVAGSAEFVVSDGTK